ncbi:uncharacterized protein LOC144130270 [Amblyomma americanum]
MTPAVPRSDKNDKGGSAAAKSARGSDSNVSLNSAAPSGTKERGGSGGTEKRRDSDRSESRLDVSGTSLRKDKDKAALTADAPTPRLCHIVRRPDFDGYGFTLLADNRRQLPTVIDVEEGSQAEAAGLRVKDRIVEVNGANMEGASHRDVVERIKSWPNETRLLVVDDSTAAWYKEHGVVIRGNLPNVIRTSSARIINARNENKGQAKAEEESTEPLVPKGTSKMADAPGIPSLSIERLSISNGVANATKAPRGKEEKPSKEPKPPAKTSKPPGAVGSTATASKPDGEPRRRQVDATTLEDNQPGSRRSTEATAQSSSERSARRGEASSSTRVSRSQVRWAPPSLNSPASPPYSSQGNDYE